MEKRIISGQLRLGDAELTSLGVRRIVAKIDSAHGHAGLNRLLFLPSHSAKANDAIRERCHKLGIEVYLWYKVLADNDIIADRDELVEDAWGKRGAGESGVWSPIFDSEETFLFACARNRKYNTLLLSRCRQALKNYDGLFADNIGFPLPSLGLESVFSCFCPECMAAEPRLAEWRRRVHELREGIVSTSDADLEKWGSMAGMVAAHGLEGLFRFRKDSITALARQYADLARTTDKGFGLDVITPAMSGMSGHDYQELGEFCDWIKPRVYYRVFGPSSLGLELYSLTRGLMAWGKRYSIPEVLRFIQRSVGVEMPSSVHALDHNCLSDKIVASEIARLGTDTACPVHPGLEFSIHPEYTTGLDAETVRAFLADVRESTGMVLCWNLLYIPDEYLKMIGEAE